MMFSYYLDLALRSLRRNRVLTALMVLAIAVGIGASMTTLTVMHLLSGDPLPGRSQHLFYPQVDPSSSPEQKQPFDMMDYRSAVDLWNAHRADRQALVAHATLKLRAPETGQPPLMAQTLALAGQIAGYSLPALMAVKECVNRAWEAPLAEGVLFERRALYERFASDDAHEGMHAFLDKRPPQFGHR